MSKVNYQEKPQQPINLNSNANLDSALFSGNQTIFLTGASGFIGSAFLKKMLASGFRIKALTRDSSRKTLHDRLEWYQADLISDDDWGEALLGVDIVVNAAAEINDVSLMQHVNFDAPKKLLNAAINSGVRRWVQLSSVGAYGPVHEGSVFEDWPDRPNGIYEVSKANFDKELRCAARSTAIEVCILRPSNVYGSKMPNHSIRQIINNIRKGLFAFIGPCGASANYVHVNDVVQALYLCVSNSRAANQTYIVSVWATMEDMVSGLASGAGLAPPSRRIPIGVASLLARMMQWWPRCPLTLSRVQAMSLRSKYSTEKIETELGWKLSVPVKEGMREFSRDWIA